MIKDRSNTKFAALTHYGLLTTNVLSIKNQQTLWLPNFCQWQFGNFEEFFLEKCRVFFVSQVGYLKGMKRKGNDTG